MVRVPGAGLIAILLLTMLAPLRVCRADAVGYTGRPTIIGQSSKFTAVHFHDWSDNTLTQRDAIYALNHHEEIFLPEKNRFSYLKLFDRASGRMLFRAPVPALTYLWVSPDGKFVVGLSRVMLCNPYQVVVFSTEGKLLYKEHISSSVAVLTQAQLSGFYARFPKSKAYLMPRTRFVNGRNFIDGYVGGMPNAIGDAAFMRLLNFRQPNPYSPNFSESVTNSVFWFNEQYPNVSIQEENGVKRLWINDPEGKPFPIVIRDSSPA